MSDQNLRDGGPAFPFEYHNQTSKYQLGFFQDTAVAPGASQQFAGLTVRQWYAGQALAGLMGLQTVYDNMADRDVAKAAYRLADAMLAEGEKP